MVLAARSTSLIATDAASRGHALMTEPSAAALFDTRWLRKGDCLPPSVRGGVLRLAVAEGDRRELLEAIRFGTGYLLEVVTADAGAIAAASEALFECLTADARSRDEAAIGRDTLADGTRAVETLVAIGPGADATGSDGDAPVARHLHSLLEEAVRERVSGIHF
jgi:type II secretory ATPase GspE/PulE/Tfp pilus assembly ATPase PilB-like protein